MTPRTRALLALGGAFSLGVVAGGFGATSYQLRNVALRMYGPPGKARAGFRVEAMARALDLSDEQRVAVRRIFERHEDERRRAFEKCEPEHRALRERIEADLRDVLSPEQRLRHEELMRRHRDERPAPPH